MRVKSEKNNNGIVASYDFGIGTVWSSQRVQTFRTLPDGILNRGEMGQYNPWTG